MLNCDNIKLVALDLDGTLLHEDKSISSETLRVIQALADRGVTIVPATGRNLSGISEELLRIRSIRRAICSNGANILDPVTGEIFYSYAIPMQDAIDAIAYLQQFPTVLYLHTDQGTVRSCNQNNSVLAERFPYIRFDENNVPDLIDYIRSHSIKIWKIGVFVLDDILFEKLLVDGSLSPNIVLKQTGKCNIELNAVQATKGNALKILCKMQGITLEQTVAIGDNQNDIEMLKFSGFSVAMGNAEKYVKDVADYVTGTNDEDGVAEFLKMFFLLDLN